MKSVPAFVLCLLLGVAVLLAGCGGGGGGNSTGGGAGAVAGQKGGAGGGEAGGESSSGGEESRVAPTSESKQEFVAKATGLCKKQQKAMQANAGKFFKKARKSSSVQANQDRFVKQVLAPGFEAEVEALRKLGAPEGEEEQVEAVLAAIELAIEEARRDPPSYFEGAAVFKEASRVPAAYGVPVCGEIS